EELATGRVDGTVTLWDLAEQRGTAALRGDAGAVTALAYDATGRRLAAVDGEQIRVWDLVLEYPRFFVPRAGVRALAFTPAGDRLTSGDAAGAIEVWNTVFPSVLFDFEKRLAQGQSEAHVADGELPSFVGRDPMSALTSDGRLRVSAVG